ncbi:hypothetical protein [Virgibacillus salexigens]|uniref:Uncharacterized protein n=1 Tax=Virgibacillus massiliensis TaxID=1462526 RepID=A0A024QI25_9BACI|nr:hypothetical protein [Virgibacillus massiliensis]CDQ41887.1 hypothetical protein BN990_04266 [Virgibacillus massiliensis]
MCKHGSEKYVWVNDKKKAVPIDACIANEIRMINRHGVVTLACCCGHGKAGQIVEYENAFGKWKEHAQPPTGLIREESVKIAKALGYIPYPYYYADGFSGGVWQMQLKTGCITEDDVNKYHELTKEEME